MGEPWLELLLLRNDKSFGRCICSPSHSSVLLRERVPLKRVLSLDDSKLILIKHLLHEGHPKCFM